MHDNDRLFELHQDGPVLYLLGNPVHDSKYLSIAEIYRRA